MRARLDPFGFLVVSMAGWLNSPGRPITSAEISDLVIRMAEEKSEGALRNTSREFVTHYHIERNNQGLENRIILPLEMIETGGSGREKAGSRGPLHYDYREAA